jgi:hypothetical protein
MRLLAFPVYLRWMILTTLGVVCLAGVLNVVADPLGVFDSPRINGLNAVKPYLDHDRELARWAAARRICPSAAIFGNSRAEIGFDPENPHFAQLGLSAFNHAIPGRDLGWTYRQMGWLKAEGCMPKVILLGVDFFDFLGGVEPKGLPAPDSAAPSVDRRFMAESVFSLAGLRDSFTTATLQYQKYPAMLTARGFNPLLNYIPEVEQSGHYVLFRQRAQENVRNWLRKPMRIRTASGGESDDEQLLNAVLARATPDEKIYVVIYPYHAEIRMMVEQLGMGALFEDWKRMVVDAAARHRNKAASIEVFDFSGISAETLESIPSKGDRHTPLEYFWEAGHFKKALGDRVIARVLGFDESFGVRLDPQNVEQWLRKDRATVKALLGTPSPLLDEVEDVIARRVTARAD